MAVTRRPIRAASTTTWLAARPTCSPCPCSRRNDESRSRMTKKPPVTDRNRAKAHAAENAHVVWCAGDVSIRFRHSERGATMLVVLMFVMVGTIALTAAMHLTAARLQQSEQLS